MRKRVDPAQLARALLLVGTLPNRRTTPRAGDSTRERYDAWFDGGAVQYVTGTTIYALDDGTRVTEAVLPELLMTVRFTDGSVVTIEQRK